jgi:hypothetical protein
MRAIPTGIPLSLCFQIVSYDYPINSIEIYSGCLIGLPQDN